MSPQWSNDYFRDAAGDASHPGRGLVGHVPIVAALMIAQGLLELGLGLLCLSIAAFAFVLPRNAMGMEPHAMAILMSIVGIPGTGCGSLRIAAGLFNWRYRRRTLGMTAMGVGLVAILTGYCAPTAIALAIYGLIVYVNESVVAAFEMGAQGRSKAEIQAAFPPDM
jgi:hypothetical protein